MWEVWDLYRTTSNHFFMKTSKRFLSFIEGESWTKVFRKAKEQYCFQSTVWINLMSINLYGTKEAAWKENVVIKQSLFLHTLNRLIFLLFLKQEISSILIFTSSFSAWRNAHRMRHIAAMWRRHFSRHYWSPCFDLSAEMLRVINFTGYPGVNPSPQTCHVTTWSCRLASHVTKWHHQSLSSGLGFWNVFGRLSLHWWGALSASWDFWCLSPRKCQSGQKMMWLHKAR